MGFELSRYRKLLLFMELRQLVHLKAASLVSTISTISFASTVCDHFGPFLDTTDTKAFFRPAENAALSPKQFAMSEGHLVSIWCQPLRNGNRPVSAPTTSGTSSVIDPTYCYDGNPGDELTPLRPDSSVALDIIKFQHKLPDSGALIIGEKGKIFSPDDYGSKFFLSMNDSAGFRPGDQHEACKDVPQVIPRSPGHMQEWFRMMKDGVPAYSNFEIAGYLAEVILLGCVALRMGEGRRMEWDGPNMRSTNLPEAAHFVKRVNRDGWTA